MFLHIFMISFIRNKYISSIALTMTKNYLYETIIKTAHFISTGLVYNCSHSNTSEGFRPLLKSVDKA